MRTIREGMAMLTGLPWWMLAYEYARAVRLRLRAWHRNRPARHGR